MSSMSKPLRSRASISSRSAPETAIWVASRRAPAEPERRGPSGSLVARRSGDRLHRLQVAAAALAPSRRVELVGQLAQALGDDPVGALARLLQVLLRLPLGVVDHARGGALGGVDDRRQALRGVGGRGGRPLPRVGLFCAHAVAIA